jgi:hypothetical protein
MKNFITIFGLLFIVILSSCSINNRDDTTKPTTPKSDSTPVDTHTSNTNTSSNDTSSGFDYGNIESGIYKNSYFNFTIKLPANWVVQSKEQNENLMDMGADMVAGDNAKMRAVLDASQVNTANLLTMFQHEVGSAVKSNPNIMIIAENLKNAPGVKDGGDYLFHTRKLIEQSQFKYDYLSKDFAIEKIGGIEFYRMDARMSYSGLEINQLYYSTVLRGFSFNIILSYSSDEEKAVLMESVNSMVFEK